MKTFSHGFAKRMMSLLLSLMMLLSLCTVGITSISAANVEVAESAATPSTIYLVPGDYWDVDGAIFRAWVWGSSTESDTWIYFSDSDGDGTYEAALSGAYTDIIFFRANPAYTSGWDGEWGRIQTTIPTDGTNCYTLSSYSDGSWSTYTSSGGESGGETTEKQTATVYVNIKNSSFASSTPYLYVWEANPEATIGAEWPGEAMSYDFATGLYYRTFEYTSSYKFIVTDNSSQTSDLGPYTAAEMTVQFSSGTTCTASEGIIPSDRFWVDTNSQQEYAEGAIDLLLPEKSDSEYSLFLPAGTDRAAVPFYFASEDSTTLTIGTQEITSGENVDLSSGEYTLSGAFTGTLKVYQSSSVATLYTSTEVSMPTTTYAADCESKDDYSTSGTYMKADSDGGIEIAEASLKKIKGRGNSSWEASYERFGKYSYNATLKDEAQLISGGEDCKKYSILANNADESRMRNMVIYDLSTAIGLEYTAKFEPVDLYNNNRYMGSYLVCEKVEIGSPLVDIVNLDKINEEYSDNNAALYDEDSDMTRGFSGGNSIDDVSTPGFYKYISNLDEPLESEYADSGFLLEFELHERFNNEISGFISNRGQQIVSKYPEFATENEIVFIMNKWNTAEAVMYNTSSTYEDLSLVIDVESFARMYLIQELSKNLDGGATSFYVWYDGGVFHAGCAWDYDWTLGQYDKDLSDRLSTSSRFYNTSVEGEWDTNTQHSEGWFINSKTIYGTSGTLNAQAQLCQNEAFWSAVTAEWNENFYSTALEYCADYDNVGSADNLEGKIDTFYHLIKDSIEMDETRWGFIASDPIADWYSYDTDDTFDETVVYLQDWYYHRLAWMNRYIGTDGDRHTGIYAEDYVIQPPVITADKESYAVGDTVTLTIEDVTGGDYTYTVYKDGAEVGTSDDGTYTFTADTKGTSAYTAVATSTTTDKSSDPSDEAEVLVEGFNHIIEVTVADEVQVGDDIIITVTSNSSETVTYTLKDADGNVIAENETGEFTVATTSADADTTKEFTVVATTTVDGETQTVTKELSVSVKAFAFSVTLTAPTSVEAGMVITLNAQAVSNSTVTYEFYTSEGTLITGNTSGIYTCDALESEIGTEKSYYVVAKTTVADTEYTATSETKTVSITEVKEVYEVTIYFKSTSTLGYRPLITTTGAVENYSDFSMEKDTAIILNKNATQTATYYWYKADVKVSKASPSLSVRMVLSNRYAMEGNITLNITESGNIFLAVDDLNAGYEMLNVTSWTEAQRNWTQSAVHMVYDADIDGADSLASVAANIELRSVGDTNGDGSVNIKDATVIQKHLAGIITLDSLSIQLADVNHDDKLTVKDATAIQKKLVALL